jgi:hydrogenase nickel incorporation protein HypB
VSAPNPVRVLDLRKDLLAKNDRLAGENRALFKSRGLRVFNLLSSPGSGKTALLERTLTDLAGQARGAVVVGDLATDNDARRLARSGAPVVQITTGNVCHLDASMIARAVAQFDLGCLDLLFIENVGNLVCPAIYDLGQAANVVVLSVTEGVDKPLKYPVMFRKADLVIISKVDLLPHLPGVSLAALTQNLAQVMPSAGWIELSATTGAGVGAFVEWLEQRRGHAGQALRGAVAGRAG